MCRRLCLPPSVRRQTPISKKRGEKYFVDNKGLNRLWLTRMGVTNIDVSQDCTMCQPERFWSHRVTKGYRGSQTGIIELKEAAQ